MIAPESVWHIGVDRKVTLQLPRIMGILNVTPDSFSDGGRHLTPASAIGAAMRMIEEGADIIDIGGESTRPGAQPVSEEEQLGRVLPVIRQLRAASDVSISIDTTRAAVARSALDAGADIINDVSAGRDDQSMLELAAARGCGLVLMHRRVQPAYDRYSDQHPHAPIYEDVVTEVTAFLLERAVAAEAAGIAHKAIVLDPGLGFGKSVKQNFALIARIDELVRLGYPVLGAASRKSFIGAVTGVELPRDRVAGSVAVAVELFRRGVHLFRVHDVGAHRQALAAASAIAAASVDAAPIAGTEA